MSRAIPFLKEIIAKARIAETLATHSETKQVLVEIRLAAGCAIEGESSRTATTPTGVCLRAHHD